MTPQEKLKAHQVQLRELLAEANSAAKDALARGIAMLIGRTQDLVESYARLESPRRY